MNGYEALKEWYVNYCSAEFDYDEDETERDFDRAHESGTDLGVLYTTFDDDNEEEHDIQVSILLKPATDLIYVDDKLIYSNTFDSFEDMAGSYECADFQGIYEWACDIAREKMSVEKGE